MPNGFYSFMVNAVANYQDHLQPEERETRAGTYLRAYPARFYLWGSRTLSTGEVIRPGQMVGLLHFDRKLPYPDPNDTLLVHTRKMYRRLKECMESLATICQNNDPVLEGIEHFYGLSHWAGPLLERLGFDVFEIRNPIRRWFQNEYAKIYASRFAYHDTSWQGLNEWQVSERNFSGVREAFIPRTKLIELHISKPVQDSPELPLSLQGADSQN